MLNAECRMRNADFLGGWMRDGCRPFGDEIGRKIWGRKIGKKGADGGWRMAKQGLRIG